MKSKMLSLRISLIWNKKQKGKADMSFEEKHKEGYELLHEKDLDKSLDIARRLQKMRHEAPEGFILEAEIMQRLNQWDASIKLLNDAIELDPESGRLFNLRGYANLNKDDAVIAKEHFDMSIVLDELPSAHPYLVHSMMMDREGQEGIN